MPLGVLLCSHNMNQEKRYENLIIEKNDRSEAVIKAEIPEEAVKTYRARAIKKLSAEISIDGFRKGHVPEDMLVKHVGEEGVLREAASLAIEEQYPHIVEEATGKESLPIIGTPNISITKLAPGNPIAFSIAVTLMPDVKLPNYKKIAVKHNAKKEDVSVTDKEVEETLTHLRRERAKIEKIESGVEPQQAAKDAQSMDTLSLPGIDDAFVQSLGFENVKMFTEKLRENIKNEKGLRAREKNRIAIMEDIIAASTIAVPAMLIEHELDGMEQQFRNDLERAGTTLEAYLSQAKKTRDELRGEWRESAEKRTKMHLVLREIAEKETVVAPKEDVDKHVEHTLSHHKDADPHSVRSYFELNLRNEAVFRFLEEQR